LERWPRVMRRMEGHRGMGFEMRFLLRCSLAKFMFGCGSRGGGYGVGGGDVELLVRWGRFWGTGIAVVGS
jgi:hypothetical protein